MVFWAHYCTLVAPWIEAQPALVDLAVALHAIGNVGVDLFFVLSGYLIYGSLIARQQAFIPFMARQVRRIYPAFVVVFVVYLGLSFAFESASKIPPVALDAWLYLLQNFLLLPGIFPIEPMITVAWSLSYEMFFYLAIPLLIGVLRLRVRNATWRVAFFLALTVGALVVGAVWGGHLRLLMFVAGILLYEACALSQVQAPPPWVGLLALVMGLLSTLLPMPDTAGFAMRIGLLFVSFFVLCLACFKNADSCLTQLFGWTPLRWLGNMSYSYYLLHGLALKAAFLLLATLLPATGHEAWLFWGVLPLMFIWTLLPSAALFLWVERPHSLLALR